MTEKRFTDIEHDFENARIRCKDDGLFMLYAIYEDDDGLDTLGNLLNGLDSDVKDLSKENEELKRENEDLNEQLMEYDSFISLYKRQRDELKEENDKLNSILEEMGNRNDEIWLLDGRIIKLKKVLKE